MTFPSSCLEAGTQRAILIRYINLYSTGEVASGYSAFDIIAAAIAIFPPEDCTRASSTIWEESDYGGADSLIETSPEFTVGEEGRQSPSTARVLKVSSKAPSQSFLDEMRRTLEATDATAAQGKGLIQVRRVLGYTALTMVRMLVKDVNQMASAFSKAQYRKNLIALLSMKDPIYCPPCAKALEHAQDAFNKQLSRPILLFSKLVNLWTLLTQKQEKKMAAMLGASCLTHTSYNGMALIHLLIEVLHHFNVDWPSLCKQLFFDITRESWVKVAKFMKEFQKKGNVQYTQPWARVIDDGYLKDMSGAENFILCTIFAAALDETIDGSGGVWDSQWAKNRQAETEDIKKIGLALRQLYTKKLSDVRAITDDAQRVLDLAKKSSPQLPHAKRAIESRLNRHEV
ncbi:unnamed protein product [Pieris macdunnoughi]|uniref:Uncharacterized protein n=1 Tax=Pieris macdunnoughi TaxID=345717 RepID=A0A821X7B0_9NEOP|nr:unnamed protein product [Pieris macdunnoughi]